jgi:hypothetical protein
VIKKLLSTLVLPVSTILVSGCGNLGGDSNYIVEARSAARSPGLTSVQRGRIFEDAGDTAVAQGRRGYADEMYFEAALAYERVASPAGLALLQRIYSKCVGIGMAQGPGCQELPSMISDRQSVAGGAPAPAQSSAGPAYTVPGRTGPVTGGAINSPSPAPGVGPAAVSGACPTTLAHIEPRLPRCTANSKLMELRRMVLEIDVSFRADRAQGLSYQQIAITNSQAAIQFENSMKQNEQAMLQASADGGLARARLAALRDTPPRCDAGPADAFGMSENAYQAYAAAYMGAVANRAVAAVAACLGRSAR